MNMYDNSLKQIQKHSKNSHYLFKYINFINSRSSRIIPEKTYTENHHVLPKCYGGNESQENLIKLSAREHFIAHWMLWKACGGKMTYAFNCMLTLNKKCKSSKHYVLLRENCSLSGENNPMFGKKHSTKSREQMSEKTKKAFIDNPELRKICAAHFKGVKLSQKTKDKMSKAQSGSNNPVFGKKAYYNSLTKETIFSSEKPLDTNFKLGSKPRTTKQKADMSKRSKGQNNGMYGIKGEKNKLSKPIKINDQLFNSITEASEQLNINRTTISHRLKSRNVKFLDWNFI